MASANTTESQRSAYGDVSRRQREMASTKWSGAPPRSHHAVYEHLAEWPRRHEAGDRLVLEQRLGTHVVDDPDGEEDHPGSAGPETQQDRSAGRRRTRFAATCRRERALASRSRGRSSVSVTVLPSREAAGAIDLPR